MALVQGRAVPGSAHETRGFSLRYAVGADTAMLPVDNDAIFNVTAPPVSLNRGC